MRTIFFCGLLFGLLGSAVGYAKPKSLSEHPDLRSKIYILATTGSSQPLTEKEKTTDLWVKGTSGPLTFSGEELWWFATATFQLHRFIQSPDVKVLQTLLPPPSPSLLLWSPQGEVGLIEGGYLIDGYQYEVELLNQVLQGQLQDFDVLPAVNDADLEVTIYTNNHQRRSRLLPELRLVVPVQALRNHPLGDVILKQAPPKQN